MKIAICLSGQPRFLDIGFHFLQRYLINPNIQHEIDFFIHSWYDSDEVGNFFDSAQESQKSMVGKISVDSDKLLINYYKPKKFIIEPQKNFDKYTKKLKTSTNAKQNILCSLFYSMYMANNLKKDYEIQNNFIYDIVLRTRTDIVYFNEIIFDNYINNLNNISVPKKYFLDQESFNNKNKPMPDIFAFSNSRNMDIFCSVYPEFLNLNSEIDPVYGENYLGEWVRNKNKLNISPIDCNLTFVQRTNLAII